MASFWDTITGKAGADAANQAAQDQYAKEQAAINKLLGYGDQYASDFKNLYGGYAATGDAANSALMRLLTDPSSVRSMPGYNFNLTEGVNALDRSAAARGMLSSGRQSKDVMRFATGLADNTQQSALQRLLSGVGIGIAGAGGVGTGLQGQLGTRATAFQGDMSSAGTIGKGMIAGANAEAAGMGNLLNLGGFLVGSAMGGMGGGGLGLGGLMGGWTNPDSMVGRASAYMGNGLTGREWYNR